MEELGFESARDRYGFRGKTCLRDRLIGSVGVQFGAGDEKGEGSGLSSELLQGLE